MLQPPRGLAVVEVSGVEFTCGPPGEEIDFDRTDQAIRERVETELLAGWGRAFLAGTDPAAVAAALREAAGAASALPLIMISAVALLP